MTLKKFISHNIKLMLDTEKINGIWWESKNWGDALNPVLIQHLSGLKPFRIKNYSIIIKNDPIYTVIGSILGWPILKKDKILKNTIIWGSGFIAESERLSGTPKQICAVRGPLTRGNLLKSGIQCPEIFGDPALLFKYIYKPIKTKKYKLGIIPHHYDKGNTLLDIFRHDPLIKIIDIENPINNFIDDICSCRCVASSSLHGIIAADTYDIPSVYVKFSDNVAGDGFKFRDYFESVGRSDTEPLIITEQTTIDTIHEFRSTYKIDIDLRELLDACPFYNNKILKIP
jgi:pyruvyltransferase